MARRNRVIGVIVTAIIGAAIIGLTYRHSKHVSREMDIAAFNTKFTGTYKLHIDANQSSINRKFTFIPIIKLKGDKTFEMTSLPTSWFPDVCQPNDTDISIVGKWTSGDGGDGSVVIHLIAEGANNRSVRRNILVRPCFGGVVMETPVASISFDRIEQ